MIRICLVVITGNLNINIYSNIFHCLFSGVNFIENFWKEKKNISLVLIPSKLLITRYTIGLYKHDTSTTTKKIIVIAETTAISILSQKLFFLFNVLQQEFCYTWGIAKFDLKANNFVSFSNHYSKKNIHFVVYFFCKCS